MFRKKYPKISILELNTSSLFDEKSFYQKFIEDLEQCKQEIIIESPYITTSRLNLMYPIFLRLLAKGVKIYVVTHVPEDLDNQKLRVQSSRAIQVFERIGVQALLSVGNHHRKLSILDRKILWEGSLNILSQANSREIMRRIKDEESAMQMFHFVKFERFV
ncbi:hypothetical protein BH09PAT1_BH09PAT1_2340 [soil metagenome]